MITFENFVMRFDGFMNPEESQHFINVFEKFQQSGLTISRQEQGSPNTMKDDDQLYYSSLLTTHELDISDMEPFHLFANRFWETAYPAYAQKYNVINQISHHTIRIMKLQKTLVGGGYHVWHNEDDTVQNMRRIMTYILYLNDVEEGGETEFLYYPKRIKPQTGTLILWPAGYTHAHRGNPPISNTKYILTGWVEMS
jgi:hypothetical protein